MLKKVNRILAFMLALIMVLGTLPGIAVFAAEPDSGALVGEAVDPVVGDGSLDVPQGADSAVDPVVGDGALDVPQGADSAADPAAGEPDLDVPQGDADLDVPQDEADAEVQADNGIMPIANTSVNFVEFDSSNGFAGSDDFKNQSTAHLEGDGVVIDSYTYIRGGTSATTITIPTEYIKDGKTYKVVRIADNAFAGMELTSITFAENSEITDIGSNAFASNNLTQFSLPASVQTLGVGCFQGNTDLTTFNFDATSSLKSIPVDCFYNCQNLTTITLPDGITSIGARAFYENDALHYIKIPGSVSEIGSQAFSNINSGTKCYIDLTEHEPGTIADAPWGNVDGFVQWSNTDKNKAYYDNDSPFIIDPNSGLILGLKANIEHDSNGGKIGSETADGSDFRWYVKQGNADHKAGGSSSGGEGGSSDDMMSADGYGASVDFTTLSSIDEGKTYTDNGITYVGGGANDIGVSSGTYKGKKGLKFNSKGKIYFTPGKDGLCTVEANYKKGMSNNSYLKITASDETQIDNIPVSDSTTITTCKFNVKAGVKYTLEREGDEFTVVKINVKYGMDSEGNQSLFAFNPADYGTLDITTKYDNMFTLFNAATTTGKGGTVKYAGYTLTKALKFNNDGGLKFTPEQDGLITLVFSAWSAKYGGVDLSAKATAPPGLADPTSIEIRDITDGESSDVDVKTQTLSQEGDVDGDNFVTAVFEFKAGKTYQIKRASGTEQQLYLAIAEYGASLATPVPEPTETPEPTEDPGSDTPKAPADYSYIHEKSDSDSFAIDDLTNGGWLDIKIPRYVKKNKDGSDTDPSNLIEIKGIADGAFATRPAVYAVHKVDFSELEGVMESIPASAFWNAQKLNNVIIPEGVKTIEKFAFRGCYALEGSEIPASAPEYAQATANDSGKKKAIYLPSTVEKVGYWAFRQCQDSLRTVIFGTQAKDGTDYTKDNRHDAPLTNIDTGAFARCYKLQHIFMQGTPQGSLRGTMTYTDGVETDEGQIPAEPFCAYDANIHYKNSKTTYAYNVEATDSEGNTWVFDRVNKDIVNYVSGATIKNNTISEITIPAALTYTDPESKSEVKDDLVIGAGQGTDNTAIFNVSSSSRSIHNLPRVTKVETLHIPATIKEINFSAFYQLGLDTIDFQGGEDSQLEDINYRAFGTSASSGRDMEIENLVFPPNIKNIGSLAFQKRTLNQTEQVELKGADDQTVQAGVLTLPGEIESVAVDAFDGAEGVGKVSVQQYRYNESDGEYNPAVSHYFDAPEDVYKNAPFGFVPTTAMSNAGIKSPQTEYVDTSLPRYSDYVLQPKNPERPNDRPHAKADPDGTNTAVINLQIIMEGKTTNVYQAEYQQNFAVPTATPDPSLPTAVPAPTMPAEAAPGTSGAQKISKSGLPQGFVFAASGDNQYVTGSESGVTYLNNESKDYFKLGSEDSIMFKSSNSGTLTLVFSAADAGNAAQINVNDERYNVSKVRDQSEMYSNAATAVIDIEPETEYTISRSSGTLNLYFIDLKYDAVSTPEPTEEPTPTPTTGTEEPAATPTPTATPETVEPTVTPGTGEPSGDGVAAGVHKLVSDSGDKETINGITITGDTKQLDNSITYDGQTATYGIKTADKIAEFTAAENGTCILVSGTIDSGNFDSSTHKFKVDSTDYELSKDANSANTNAYITNSIPITKGTKYTVTKGSGTKAALCFIDITYTSGDSGIDGPSIASAAKYAPASNLKLIPLEYELDPRAGGENIINNEWWSGDAKLSEPKQTQVDLPENWKTDPQSGLGTQNNADVPYQIDLTNIRGNGTATFTVYYRPEGQPYITIDYHDVLVDVFHKQLYNKNESGGTVNGDLPTQDDAQPEGGADGEKNMYVEGYKVKIKNVDQANFFKKEGAQLCAFAGWLVVPNGADDPKITSGLNKIYDVPPQLSDFTSAKALTDAELTDESISSALKGFVGADGVAFIGYQNLTSGDFTFPMGETDRTLYAVWATDNDGDGIPDYSDLRKLNYHMNGGYWTNGETTYGDDADSEQIDPYSVFVPKNEPAYDVYQNNVDPVKNEIENYAGLGKKMKFAFLGWNLKQYPGYIDAEGNYIDEEGNSTSLEEDSDIVKNMVTTIDTRDDQNIYDLYAVWARICSPIREL